MSAFAFEDGVVHHTYSAYSRGLDPSGLCGSGSIERHSAATRATRHGSVVTTSTRTAIDNECAHRLTFVVFLTLLVRLRLGFNEVVLSRV
jgi:hypothetical protein